MSFKPSLENADIYTITFISWLETHYSQLNKMTEHKIKDLESVALRVREHIIKMSTDGGCFVGASLSATDLMVYLYAEFLNVFEENLQDPERDYLFLSKGHDVPALYGTLVEMGIPKSDIVIGNIPESVRAYTGFAVA